MLRELGIPFGSSEIKDSVKKVGEGVALGLGIRMGSHVATLGTMGELSLLAYVAGVPQQTATNIVLAAGLGLFSGSWFLSYRLLSKA